MKKTYLLWLLPLCMAACQSKTASTASTGMAATPNYPYKIKHPDYWMMDTSTANTMTALNSLKAFEKWDTVAAEKTFADTIEFNLDYFKYKGSFSGMIKSIAPMMAGMTNLKLDMKDWEAVVSKDKKEQWVTVWYTQKWTDAKGKADSVMLVDDMQFKGGKIVKLNEYDMHAAPPMKKK